MLALPLAGELELDRGEGVRHTGARGHLRPVEAGAGMGHVESHGQASLGHLCRLGRAVVGAGLGHREPQGQVPVGLLWQASWSCSWGASGRVKS